MVVSGGGNRQAQQILIVIHRFDYRTEKQQKLGVFIGSFTGGQQINAGVGCHGPVVMFAAAVDAGKGLFMQQANEPMTRGYLLHDFHSKLVVIGSNIRSSIDWR